MLLWWKSFTFMLSICWWKNTSHEQRLLKPNWPLFHHMIWHGTWEIHGDLLPLELYWISSADYKNYVLILVSQNHSRQQITTKSIHLQTITRIYVGTHSETPSALLPCLGPCQSNMAPRTLKKTTHPLRSITCLPFGILSSQSQFHVKNDFTLQTTVSTLQTFEYSCYHKIQHLNVELFKRKEIK